MYYMIGIYYFVIVNATNFITQWKDDQFLINSKSSSKPKLFLASMLCIITKSKNRIKCKFSLAAFVFKFFTYIYEHPDFILK